MAKKRSTRRRFTKQQKDDIGRQANAEGARVTDVARQHDVTPKQVYHWRSKMLAGGEARSRAPAQLGAQAIGQDALAANDDDNDDAQNTEPSEAFCCVQALYAVIGEQHMTIFRLRRRLAEALRRPLG